MSVLLTTLAHELRLAGYLAAAAAAVVGVVAFLIRPRRARRAERPIVRADDADLQARLEEWGLHELTRRVLQSRSLAAARDAAMKQLFPWIASPNWYVERDVYLQGVPVPLVLFGPAAYAVFPNDGWNDAELLAVEMIVEDLQAHIDPAGIRAGAILYSPYTQEDAVRQRGGRAHAAIWSVGGPEQLRRFLDAHPRKDPGQVRLDLYREGAVTAAHPDYPSAGVDALAVEVGPVTDDRCGVGDAPGHLTQAPHERPLERRLSRRRRPSWRS